MVKMKQHGAVDSVSQGPNCRRPVAEQIHGCRFPTKGNSGDRPSPEHRGWCFRISD